jgi:hypothetical protein
MTMVLSRTGQYVATRTRPSGPSWEYIRDCTVARRTRDSFMVRRMIDVRDRVNGDIVTPLPDVLEEPNVWAPMASLVSDAIEHNAMRAGSIPWTTYTPEATWGERSEERQKTRRRAAAATDKHSNSRNLARRAFRHLYGYGTYSLICTPDLTWCNRLGDGAFGRARFEMRDPLQTYAEQHTPDDMRPPLDVAYVYGKSTAWIMAQWGDNPAVAKMVASVSPQTTELWDVVEWVDENWTVVGILGAHIDSSYLNATLSPLATSGIEMHRWPTTCNGLVPAVTPYRVTLDRAGGAVGHLIGITDWIARLTALEVVAADKGVFPDMALLADEGVEPKIVNGSWASGRSGMPNLLSGVKAVQLLHNQPNLQTRQLIEALENNFSSSAGLLPQYSGNQGGMYRTGRAIQQSSEIASDPRLQEMQETWALGKEHLTKCAFEMEKERWPQRKFVVFSGFGSDMEVLNYTPADDFDTTEVAVGYPFPGVDMAQLTVMLPQLVGAKLISRESAMRAHPLVFDAELEQGAVRAEQLEDVVFQTLLAAAQQPPAVGQPNVLDLLGIAEQLEENGDLLKAMRAWQTKVQAAQAQAQPPAGEAPPEQMPGMMAPAAPSEQPMQQPPAAPPGPTQGFPAILQALAARPGAAPPGGLPSPIAAPAQTQVQVR